MRWINKGSQVVPVDILRGEQHYGGQYIADLCISGGKGWTNQALSIYWQPKPDFSKGHTHYYALYVENGRPFITNGISCAEGVWEGVESESGEIIFSRWRHDFRMSADKTAHCDGGRDYFKFSGKPVKLKLDGPDFRVI